MPRWTEQQASHAMQATEDGRRRLARMDARAKERAITRPYVDSQDSGMSRMSAIQAVTRCRRAIRTLGVMGIVYALDVSRYDAAA